MANFKIGDRVRLVVQAHPHIVPDLKVGTEGTIKSALTEHLCFDGEIVLGYAVNFDDGHSDMACYPFELAPLAPPKDEAWEAFKTLVCTPDPVLASEKV